MCAGAAVSSPWSEQYRAFLLASLLHCCPLLLMLFASAWCTSQLFTVVSSMKGAAVTYDRLIWALTISNLALYGRILRRMVEIFVLFVPLFDLFRFCVFKCCFTCPQTNSHKGELCKMEGWRDGKGSFIHLFLNVFVGVVCIVLFNLYVPLLITSDQFFQWNHDSCSFKCTNGNEPNISAVDTVT